MLRDLSEDESLAAQTLGLAAAEALIHRLADIRAADTIAEVLAGRPQIGNCQGVDCYQFELAEGRRLTLVSSHVVPRNNAFGRTDWARVHRVRVISLDQ